MAAVATETMQVTFGGGRRALEFGPSKINLHQAGQERESH